MEPERPKLLPVRLSRFAPHDPRERHRIEGRLRTLSRAALEDRQRRIDRRLGELGRGIGAAALKIPSVRGTGLEDLDRVLRKIDALDRKQEDADMEREATEPAHLLHAVALDLEWVGRAFASREERLRRDRLVAELGLALCACDHRQLAEYAPHIHSLMQQVVLVARRIDELFVQAELVEREAARRLQEGEVEGEARPIDALLERARDRVEDVSAQLGDRLGQAGKSAAKSAAKTSGAAMWGLAKGLGRGAWALGSLPFRNGDAPKRLDPPPEPEPVEPNRTAPPSGPDAAQIPTLLRDLARLRDDGILDEREFAAKKAELLKRL